MRRQKLWACFVAVLLLPFDLVVAALILLTDLTSLPLRFLARSVPLIPLPNCDVVTIQILNWDGKHLLAEALPALVSAVEAAGGRHEIVVVDNGSTDGSVEFLRNDFPG